MALFESYERRIDKINGVLAQYGISSVEECREICKAKGFDPYEIVKGIQPICFENACWAYTVGAAIALKKNVKTAAEAAEAIGIGLQAFCIDGSVAEDRKVVIPGFYGVMPDGHIRTFSRGGSDITGALAAAALDADVYENWTDVSGILMADPRIVDDPQAIPEVTYDELRELSYSGAQVLHEDSIFPVREKNIPVNIRNTNDPDAPGTMIQESFSGDVDPDRFITGITGKKDFSIISLTKRGMSNQVGVLRRVLSVLERHNISVDYVPNGIDNVSVVLPTAAVEKELYTIMAEIKKEAQPDTLDVHHHIAVVAAVGRKMAFRPGISGRIFKALGESGINIRMINQGPDELNIIFGVDNKDFKEAIRVLYNSFVK